MTFIDLQPVAIAGLATASSFVYIAGKRYLENQRSDVPKVQRIPDGHWLWGHEYDAFQASCGEYYSENAEKLGQVYSIKGAFFHPDILVVIDPAALSHIFTKHVYGYVKSPVIRPLIARLMGRSLVWSEGDEHKQLRQMLAPVFSAEMVKGMEDNIRVAADKLVESLHTEVLSSTKETRINILEYTFRASLDIIGSVGFGFDFQSGQSPEAKEILRLWRELVSTGLSFAGFLGPIVLRTFPFITSLPVASIQAQGEILLLIKKLALEIVEARKASGEHASAKAKDLLSTLMRATGVDGSSTELDGDLDRLLEHIVTFVMVGHETTSAVLNYSLWELARNPEIQSRLREEITSFRGSGKGGEPTYEEYQSKLPLLDAICKEGLRLYPPASHTERVAVNDDVLPLRYPITTKDGEKLTSIKINKGQVIYVPSISINRSKAAWGPDADEFRPDRWLAPNKLPTPSSLTQGWSGIFTFLEGPRICIGYRLALFEYKIILSSLIKNFEFSSTGENVRCQFSATLQPRVVGREDEGVQLPCYIKIAS